VDGCGCVSQLRLKLNEEESNEMAEHVGIKIVTKRLKDGTVKRYKYYQLVRTHRERGKHKTKYVRYLGKEIPPELQHRYRVRDVLANRDRDQDPTPLNPLPSPPVLANQGQGRDPLTPSPLDLEVIEPKERGYWSFPRYRATCRRCGERFELIQFEVELGHYLCKRCRVDVLIER